MSTNTDSGGMTQDDIMAHLRDELGVPRLCVNHLEAEQVSTFFRRGTVQFAQYSCGCRYDAATQKFSRE